MSNRRTWILLVAVAIFAFSGGAVAATAYLLGPMHLQQVAARTSPTPSTSPSPLTSPSHSPSPLGSPAPSARAEASWAFDASTASFLLYGGHQDTFAPLSDTWTWDGTHWVEQSTSAVGPSARFGAPMVYDSARNAVVLHAGNSGTEFNWPNDTWTWDGTHWTLMSPISAPPAGDGFHGGYEVMAWDEALKVVFDFDVLPDGSVQTWAWDGANWSQRVLTNIPFGHGSDPRGAAYDAARTSVVLFGTSQGGPATWTFDGTAFSQVLTSSGTGSASFSMAADDAHSNVVLFGGNGDTWTWDGTHWIARNPSHAPPARDGAGMAYDSVHHVVVLYGGWIGRQPLDDIWTWNGSDWTKVFPTG